MKSDEKRSSKAMAFKKTAIAVVVGIILFTTVFSVFAAMISQI